LHEAAQNFDSSQIFKIKIKKSKTKVLVDFLFVKFVQLFIEV